VSSEIGVKGKRRSVVPGTSGGERLPTGGGGTGGVYRKEKSTHLGKAWVVIQQFEVNRGKRETVGLIMRDRLGFDDLNDWVLQVLEKFEKSTAGTIRKESEDARGGRRDMKRWENARAAVLS